MIDAQITRATCEVRCGDEIGTGWLVTSDRVVTARHCIDEAILEGAQVSLRFDLEGAAGNVNAKVVAEDETLDVCVLLLEREIDLKPIRLGEDLPIEGHQFTAFGFPVAKLSVGHRLDGSISRVLNNPRLGIDIDLQVAAPAALSDYKGISGAALISNGRCTGMLRIAVDKSLGAISVARMVVFLRASGVPIDEAPEVERNDQAFASREDFTKAFDSIVVAQAGGYVFIEGAHGIGKSTFCENYHPLDATLEYFDTYSFTSHKSTINAMHLAQPEVFFDWLNTSVTSYLTGRAGRVSVKSYHELITGVERLLEELGQAYSFQRKIGVLFVDGLDEAGKLDEGTLERFVGLFPHKLPAGLVIVFSAPSYVNLSAALGTRIGRQSCIKMQSLRQSAARAFCVTSLLPECSSAGTVRVICDRAQGHPLYLHYLIGLANRGADDDHLAALPLIDGSIRNYYETLWPQLQGDPEAVNLLAIIARLRWGILTQELAEILTEAERMVLVTTIERIQHLLLQRDETTIYHSSFADFLIEKTALRELDVQLRLAQYCENHPDNRYGTLNLVYHGLRSGSERGLRAVAYCNQAWVDQCVTLGANPDALLGDLDDALEAATHQGSFTEVIRILLLTQRLQFRYDTLFVQSADLAAGALLSLGKTQETLKLAVRYGRLIVPVHQALSLAFQLTTANEAAAAQELLDKAEAVLEAQMASQNLSIRHFLALFELQVQLLLLRHKAGDGDAWKALQGFYYRSIQAIRGSVDDENELGVVLAELAGYFQASSMCLAERYAPVSAIREHFSGSIALLANILLELPENYQRYCSFFGLVPDRNLLEQVFADLRALVDEIKDEERDSPGLGVIDASVTLGAPRALLSALVEDGIFGQLEAIQFIAADNISIDEVMVATGMAQWRLAALLDEDLPCPAEAELYFSKWQGGVDLICRTVAWCDGAARRVKENQDEVELLRIWTLLEQRVFDQFRFTLAQRVEWEDSYAIPESIIPYLYDRLTSLITEVFPDQLGYLLTFIEEQFSVQCGLYSEGFRAILAKVLDRISRLPVEPVVEDQAFELLRQWRDFVQVNIKNRHELVPELLTLIPLFVRLNASEEAHHIYQVTLAVSMGPTWYKEDQLGLITETLGHIPADEPFEAGTLPRVAALLEVASGEMTFQRFVRYNKRDLVGVLCYRGGYHNAVRYFIRQTCGTAEQLLAEVSEGEIDRLSHMRGTRFPGGALDEQAAIYSMLESVTPTAHWPLCWALLEIYQFGDRRHIEQSAEAYGRLIERESRESDAQTAMVHRLRLICESELEESQRDQFLSSLRNHLSVDLLESIEEFINVPSVAIATEDLSAGDCGHETERDGDERAEAHQAHDGAAGDSFVMPGLFGTSDSTREAAEALSRAERHLARGNTSAAQREAQTVLEHFQSGGWSIWGNLSPKAKRAEDILLHTSKTTDDIVKIYSRLIINERYVEKWRCADHLIERIASIATPDERMALVGLVIEHAEIMVGDTEAKSSEYRFLEERQAKDASSSLIQLLLHTIDHPKWLRREKAAEMVLWLLESHPQYVPIIGPAAFTMGSSNLPDVICGVLDHLSLSDAADLWERLGPALDLDDIQQNVMHVGRRSVLLRIVERATRSGSTGAAAVLENLRAAFPQSIEDSDESIVTGAECPTWALIAKYQWRELNRMGLATPELIERASITMQNACAPLSVDTFIELERLLVEGFREDYEHPLGRWMAKVRYVLQVALMPIATEELHTRIEQIFRPYNPASIERFRIMGFSTPSSGWLTTLSNQNGAIQPISGDDVYLDFLERIWVEDRWMLFRLTAFFYNRNTAAIPPEHSATFLSTDQPKSEHAKRQDSCATVAVAPAFFGSFTPALPSATLKQLTGTTGTDLTRGYWRIGRLSESRGAGPKNEGCFLSVKRANLRRLPDNVRLAWVYEVDGIKRGVVTYG